MSRRGKGYLGPKREFTDEQAEKRFEANLDRLDDLCSDYDKGRTSYALLIAVEVHKMLTEGGRHSTQRRSKVTYPGPDRKNSPKNLMPFYLLTVAQVTSTASKDFGTFLHEFDGRKSAPRLQKFKHWWNEIIFRAGAAPPGAPPGLVPVNGSPVVPFDERACLKRRELIAMLRNHAGAHDAKDFPLILDEIDGPNSWGGFAVQDAETGEIFSTDDGTLEWQTGQLAASARQIGEEVLIAFGRRPMPPINSES